MSVSPAKSKYIVGLTGGISTGKSTAYEYLIQNGFFGIDCDTIVHDLYKRNKELLNFCKKTFNTVERKDISKIVFDDSNKREKLEVFIHPLVLDEIDKIVENADGLIVIDMPLLFEINYQEDVDLTVLIYLSKEQQIERLIDRNNLSKEFANKIIEAQMSLEIKMELADVVINNCQDINCLHKELDNLIKGVRDESQRHFQS